jgi:hypothetical protein
MVGKQNLLLRVAALALVAGEKDLPLYSHPNSPHHYTQPQLLALLVLKAYLKLTYRQTVELLEVSDTLQRVPGLKGVPRHTTLEEFASRVADAERIDRLLGHVLAIDGRAVTDVAGDSTGLSPTRASVHYRSRSGKKGGHYVKLSLIVACTLLLPVSMSLARGPANDLSDARTLLWRAAGRCVPQAAYFDRGYDAEWVHRFFRDGLGCTSYIPPNPHTKDGSIKTPYRAECQALPKSYGRRWHVESFFSGLKGSTGSSLKGPSDASRFSEAALRVLAYAIRRV